MACVSGFASVSRTSCGTCGPGQRGDAASQSCVACERGTFQATAGVSAGCERCAAGTYANRTGASVCESCPIGRAAPNTGSYVCACLLLFVCECGCGVRARVAFGSCSIYAFSFSFCLAVCMFRSALCAQGTPTPSVTALRRARRVLPARSGLRHRARASRVARDWTVRAADRSHSQAIGTRQEQGPVRQWPARLRCVLVRISARRAGNR